MQSLQDTDFCDFFFLKTHMGDRGLTRSKTMCSILKNNNASTNKITMHFLAESNVTSQYRHWLAVTSEYAFALGNICKLFCKLACETCTFALWFRKIVHEQYLYFFPVKLFHFPILLWVQINLSAIITWFLDYAIFMQHFRLFFLASVFIIF